MFIRPRTDRFILCAATCYIRLCVRSARCFWCVPRGNVYEEDGPGHTHSSPHNSGHLSALPVSPASGWWKEPEASCSISFLCLVPKGQHCNCNFCVSQSSKSLFSFSSCAFFFSHFFWMSCFSDVFDLSDHFFSKEEVTRDQFILWSSFESC